MDVLFFFCQEIKNELIFKYNVRHFEEGKNPTDKKTQIGRRRVLGTRSLCNVYTFLLTALADPS